MKHTISYGLIIIIVLWSISTLIISARLFWADLDEVPDRYIDDLRHFSEVYYEEPVVLQWDYFQKLRTEIERIDRQNVFLFLGYIITSFLLIIVSLSLLMANKKLNNKRNKYGG